MNDKNTIPEKCRGNIDGIFFQRGLSENPNLNKTYVFVACDAGRIEESKEYHKTYRAIKEVHSINTDFAAKAIFYTNRLSPTSEITEKDIDLEKICNLNI